MVTAVDNIHVFKTNIRTLSQQESVAGILDKFFPQGGWNIDREDIDCVLRVESSELNEEEIIQLITQSGFSCSELA